MIIIQIDGGLGNQMFQYALGIMFEKRGVQVKYDISKFEQQQVHNGYELERVFNIRAKYCSKAEREIVKRISKLRHFFTNSPYKEKEEWQWRYWEEVSQLKFGFLKGYWQTADYFSGAEKEVKQKFQFQPLQGSQNKAVMQKIMESNSVSLHIRRGDYLDNDINCSLGLPYYNEAIKFINTNISNPSYFVFSDDIEWAKENIKQEQMEFIGWNKGGNSYIDMQLMSSCKHNIIANSSFSWWAAWLNSNPDKKIAAPQQWMRHLQKKAGIIPKGWIQFPNNF